MTCRSALLPFFSAALALGVCTSAALAQAPARLSGRVLDASGRPGSFAVVRLVSDTGATTAVHPQRYTLLGDALGKFSQEGIAPGAYLVMLFTDGKGTDLLKRVVLRPGEAAVLTLSAGMQELQIAGISSGTAAKRR